MRLIATLSLSTALLAVPTVASASVIFSDGFGGLNTALTQTSAGNFTTMFVSGPSGTQQTNVDTIKNGDYGINCGASTGCVDLGGTDNSPYNYGALASNTLFLPGKYILSFQATGTQRGQQSELKVQLGQYNYNSGLIASGASINKTVVVIVPASDIAGDLLTFTDGNVPGTTDGNYGIILQGATVSSTPEPSSLALLGTGLLSSVGMMARRRKV